MRSGISMAREQYIPGDGTRRRLEALHRLGWSGGEIGRRLGVSFEAVHQLRNRQRIYASTAERVAALYDDLWDRPATGPVAIKTRRWAMQMGYALPLEWDDDEIDSPAVLPHLPHTVCGENDVDEVAVARILAGEPVNATRTELSQARDTLERMGLSAREIAERLGVSDRTVQRYRARQRAA